MGIRVVQRNLHESHLNSKRKLPRYTSGEKHLEYKDLTPPEKRLVKSIKAFVNPKTNTSFSNYESLRHLNADDEFRQMIGDSAFHEFYMRLKPNFSIYMAVLTYLTFEEVAILTRDLHSLYMDPQINNGPALTKIEAFSDPDIFTRDKPHFLLIPGIHAFVTSQYYPELVQMLGGHEIEAAKVLFEPSPYVDPREILFRLASLSSSFSAVSSADDFIRKHGAKYFVANLVEAARMIHASTPENAPKLGLVREMLGKEGVDGPELVMRFFESFSNEALSATKGFVDSNSLDLSAAEMRTLLENQDITADWGPEQASLIRKLKEEFNLPLVDDTVFLIDSLMENPQEREKLEILRDSSMRYSKAKYGSPSFFGEVVLDLLGCKKDEVSRVYAIVSKGKSTEILDQVQLASKVGVDKLGLAIQIQDFTGRIVDNEFLEQVASIENVGKKLQLIAKSGIFKGSNIRDDGLKDLATLLNCDMAFIGALCRLEKLGVTAGDALAKFPTSSQIMDLSGNPRCKDILLLGKRLRLKAHQVFKHRHSLGKALAIRNPEKLAEFIDRNPERFDALNILDAGDLSELFSKKEVFEIKDFLIAYPSLRKAGISPDPSIPVHELMDMARKKIAAEMDFKVEDDIPLENLVRLKNAGKRLNLVIANRNPNPLVEQGELELLVRRIGEFTVSPFERNEGPRRDVILQTIQNPTKRTDRFGNIWVSAGKGGRKLLVSAHMDTTYGLSAGDYYFDFDGRNFVGSLDNSIGCAMASLLCERTDYPFDIDFVFTFSEETGNPSEMGAAKVVSELRRAKKKVDLCLTVDVTYSGEGVSTKLGYIESFNPPSLAFVLKNVFRRSNADSLLGGRQGNTDDEGLIVYGKEFPTFFVGPAMEGLNRVVDETKATVKLNAVEAVFVFLKKILRDTELVKFADATSE